MTQIRVSWLELTSAEEITIVETIGVASGVGTLLANAWITSIERDDDLVEAEARDDDLNEATPRPVAIPAIPRSGYPTIPVREM